MLESITWPWSDAQDERAYKPEMEQLTKIAGALYLALTLSGEIIDWGYCTVVDQIRIRHIVLVKYSFVGSTDLVDLERSCSAVIIMVQYKT